jgi:hypothetical protein
MLHKVKRNFDGWVIEDCPVNVGVKIGSFDCTANCPNNQNTPQEIQKYGFDIPEIKCKKADELPNQNNQLTIEI